SEASWNVSLPSLHLSIRAVCHREPRSTLFTDKLLVGIPVEYLHAECRLGLLRCIDFECLRGLCGRVVSPQPGHLLGELRLAMTRIVASCSETEVKVVTLQFKRIGHAYIGEGPASVADFQVVGTVLKPDADVAARLAENFILIVLTTVCNSWSLFPLDAAEAADPGNYPAEQLRHL